MVDSAVFRSIVHDKSAGTYILCTHLLTTHVPPCLSTSNSGCDQKMREEEPETDVNMAYGTPREIMAHRNAAL